MNVKFFPVIIILIFLSLTAVSAENNTTDGNLTVQSSDVNVSFDEVMWKENLTDINVELPENTTGDFCVKINDEIIYNHSITNKSFKVPVKLPTRSPEFYISIYPPLDCRYYKVSAFLNGDDLNINKTLKVMLYPQDYQMLYFPDEILQHSPRSTLIAFPRSANGSVEFYIDDKLFNRTAARPIFHWDKNPFSQLSLGNHTFRIVYHGDRYYKAFDKTFNFTVTNVIIDIPERLNIGHDDCVYVATLENTTGTVKVYIDNKLIHTSKTDDGTFVLSLEEYIKYTDREIRVEYTSKNFSRTKTQAVNMTYDFDFWGNYFTYGDENIIEITLPDTLNNKLLSVSINGTRYSFKRSDYENNIVEVNVSRLPVGNYTLHVTYIGDEKFYALEKDYNFTVSYNFKIPWDVTYKDLSAVSLKLPQTAKGYLTVYVDGKYFKSVKMNNGFAKIRLDLLSPGRHNISVIYDGDDFNVTSKDSFVYVEPKITVTYKFRAGENKYVKLEVPKNTKGYALFDIDGKVYKVKIKNGIAKYCLKNLKPGTHDISVDYYGADGVENLYNWREITVKKPLIKLSLKKVKIKKSAKKLTIKATLKINGKAVKGKKLKFKFKNKTYTAKTNKKGTAKITIKKSVLKKLKTGKKVKYQVKYSKKTVKRTVKVTN